MVWANSKVFRPYVADIFGNITAMDADADSFKAALYNGTITPDNDVTAANSAYNVGQWATAQECFESGQWSQAGQTLASTVLNSASADVVFFDAADTASGAAADLTSVNGALVYDDTIASPVADQGVSYNYFGGANSVVNGLFTVLWHANGIWRASL